MSLTDEQLASLNEAYWYANLARLAALAGNWDAELLYQTKMNDAWLKVGDRIEGRREEGQ